MDMRRRKQTEAVVGRKVRFELQVDRNLGVEARCDKLVKDPLSSSAGLTIFLSSSSSSAWPGTRPVQSQTC